MPKPGEHFPTSGCFLGTTRRVMTGLDNSKSNTAACRSYNEKFWTTALQKQEAKNWTYFVNTESDMLNFCIGKNLGPGQMRKFIFYVVEFDSYKTQRDIGRSSRIFQRHFVLKYATLWTRIPKVIFAPASFLAPFFREVSHHSSHFAI